MFGHLNDPSPPQPGPEDRDAVRQRAHVIVRHRQAAMGLIAAALVVLIAVPALALSGSGGGRRKVNTIAAPTTQSSEDTTTVPTAGVVTPVSATSTTVAQTPTTTRSGTTTTTALVCRNSTDPRCGPFRWDPAPAPNQPLSFQMTYSPSNPQTGQQVTFHIVADDPDGGFLQCKGDPNEWSPEFGDGTRVGHGCPYSCPNELLRYGPWTPPVPFPGHSEGDLTHVYSQAGRYTVSVSLWTGSPCAPDPYDPYRSHGTATVTVDISGPPVTTTTR